MSRAPDASLELQVFEECLLWGLKYLNIAYFGLIGSPAPTSGHWDPQHFVSFQMPQHRDGLYHNTFSHANFRKKGVQIDVGSSWTANGPVAQLAINEKEQPLAMHQFEDRLKH